MVVKKKPVASKKAEPTKKTPTTTKKKPTAKSATGGEVTKTDLVNKFKKHKKLIQRLGKETAPAGYVEDSVIIEALKLKPGKGKQIKARLTSAKFTEVNDKPILKLRWIVQEGEAKGQPVTRDIWLDPEDDEALEKEMKELVFILQKMGYETEDDLTIDMIFDLAEELMEEKPYCILYINCYLGKSGKNKGKEKYGVRVNSSYEPKEGDEDESDDEDDEEDEETSEDEDSEESDDSDSDEESDDSDDESDSDEEEEDEVDEDDPSTWIGYGVIAKIGKKKAEYTVVKFDKKKNLLTLENDDGKITADPKVVVDFASEEE